MRKNSSPQPWARKKSGLNVGLILGKGRPYPLIFLNLFVIYQLLEDVPRSTPGYWKVLDTIRAKMKLAIMKLNNKIIVSIVCIQKFSKELFRS